MQRAEFKRNALAPRNSRRSDKNARSRTVRLDWSASGKRGRGQRLRRPRVEAAVSEVSEARGLP